MLILIANNSTIILRNGGQEKTLAHPTRLPIHNFHQGIKNNHLNQ
jgi:hypothetical protein